MENDKLEENVDVGQNTTEENAVSSEGTSSEDDAILIEPVIPSTRYGRPIKNRQAFICMWVIVVQ